MNTMTEKITLVSSTQRNDLNIGELLLDSGKISAQDAERILQAQKESGLRFGEAAIKLGLASEGDIQFALATQFDYPCLTKDEGNFSPELVAAYEPFTSQVEALRALRTQLLLRWFNLGHKHLAVVATNPGEGCSNLAANLAVVFSQLGERTLLIDGNLRTPRQHLIFNLGNRAGLSEILAGRADTGSIVRISQLRELSVLTAGAMPPNPTELIGGGKLAALLQTLGGQYDVILIDTPPATQSGDAQNIASLAGGALLVARKGYAKLREIDFLKAALNGADTPIVGAAMNQF